MIQTGTYGICIDSLRNCDLGTFIREELEPSSIVLITDTHTHEHCLAYTLAEIPELQSARIIQVPAGEEAKNLDTCNHLWQTLLQWECDRKTVIVNLGGGVITDMGGFVAATYKRGIPFIHIPTTLLSQVDASVGSKTGIDIALIKNQVGVFADPAAVFIDTTFLRTLSKRELLNGFAEMIKHALLDSEDHYESVRHFSFHDLKELNQLIERSVRFKLDVIQSDPKEKGRRKILNFGHTVGHALESFSMENARKELKHGEAVGIGMLVEMFLSVKHVGFPMGLLEDFAKYIPSLYPEFHFDRTDINRILEIMRSDKKNVDGKINFSLLKQVGQPVHDIFCKGGEIEEALMYYRHVAGIIHE